MKYLPLIFVLLTGCSFHPKYKVGDCFIDNPKQLESWETDKRYFHKVIQVGKNSYQVWVNQIGDKTIFKMTFSFNYGDYGTFKIECPKSLENE